MKKVTNKENKEMGAVSSELIPSTLFFVTLER